MGVGAAIKFGAKALGKWAGKKALDAGKESLTGKTEPAEVKEKEKKEFISKTLQQIFDELKNTSSYDTVEVNEGWHDDYNPETTEDKELNEKEKVKKQFDYIMKNKETNDGK